MNNMISGTEIIDFGGRFRLQKQRKFNLGSSRNIHRCGHRFIVDCWLIFRSKMKAVRRQCMALLSGMLNVFQIANCPKLL